MRVIEKIAVVVSNSSEQFHDTLMESIQRFQEEGLEVTINNPHFVREAECSFKHYGAIVEGRKTVPAQAIKKTAQPDPADSQFPSFNVNPKQ